MGSREDLPYASKASCAIRRPGRGEGPCFGTQQPGGGRLPILSLVPVYPLPSGLIPVPWYQSAGSGGYKAAGRSRPPGLCHPRARWWPPRSYGRDAGRRAGDSFVASPGHLVNQFSTIAAAGGPPDGAAGARPLCVPITATGQGVHWMAPLARVPSAPHVGSPHGRPYGWRRRCPSPRATSCLRRQAWLS